MSTGVALEGERAAELNRAVMAARAWAVSKADTNPNASAALSYIDAHRLAVHIYGLEAVVPQLAYTLSNLAGWRGPEAVAAKKIMRDAIKFGESVRYS